MTVNSFFAGIGGFDLGFEKLGFTVKFQCEIDDFCTTVLNKHWPKTPVARDIKKVKPEEIPDAEIWCGGFPCQDVSVARGAKGRDGLNGKNSGLFFDFIDLVAQKKPKIILLENVTGLLNSHKGHDFKIILDSLTSLGYGVSWRVLNTRYFGAPQSRPRVYLCAWYNSPENAMYALHEYSSSPKPNNPREGFLKVSKSEKLGVYVPQIAYCLAATSGRHTGTDWSRTYVSYSNKVRRITPTEAEKMQGFPQNWTIPKSISNASNLDSLRYHAIGNAVSVPTIMWIANRIKSALKKRNGYSTFNSVPSKFEDFALPTTLQTNLEETIDKNGIKWNSGGIAFKNLVIHSKTYPCSNNIIESKLIDIIDRKKVEDKYFLSSSAAKGILRRVNSQKRVLFKPLNDALEQLALNTKNEQIDHL